MDWERIQSGIEDLLFPQRDLDVWERVVYYHLLRQTRTIGIEQALVAIQPLSIALRVGQTKVGTGSGPSTPRAASRSRIGQVRAISFASYCPRNSGSPSLEVGLEGV
jgi:hypothetical protein